MTRHDGRAHDQLRPIKMTPGFLKHPAGSVLIEAGETRVLCTATVEERVPLFLKGSGEGWVTGEYAMIPAATDTRSQREVTKGRQSGRSLEIQRLIGRALRSVVDRTLLGERTVWVDCDVLQADGGTRTASVTGGFVALDVLQADGGTRTASVTGGFVALCLALAKMRKKKVLNAPPLSGMLAAVSVGIVEGHPLLDLDYVEDSAADVDMNVARVNDGRYVEIQGTAETTPFRREQLDALLAHADKGIDELFQCQREALGSALDNLIR